MNRRNSEDASAFDDLTGTAEDELGPFQAIAHMQRSSQRLDETIMWMTTWMTTSRSLFFRLSDATTRLQNTWPLFLSIHSVRRDLNGAGQNRMWSLVRSDR